MFIQARAQHLHRPFLVLVLRALVLTTGDDAGRQMRNAHGRVRRVHVLAALAPRPVRVDAQLVGFDVDDDGIVDLRRNVHGSEAGVAALGLIKRRDAYQPMHTCLSLQQAKGKLAGDGEGRGLDPRLIAILDLVDLGLEALALGPAQVHAHQHLGPVLRLRAASARVHGHNGVQRVVLFGEHGT